MKHWGNEHNVWGLVWIVLGKCHLELESTVFPRSIFGTNESKHKKMPNIYPKITQFQENRLFSSGAALIPGTESVCNRLKSFINRLLAGVVIEFKFAKKFF